VLPSALIAHIEPLCLLLDWQTKRAPRRSPGARLVCQSSYWKFNCSTRAVVLVIVLVLDSPFFEDEDEHEHEHDLIIPHFAGLGVYQ
jgi:hypothetical protein